MFGTLLYILEVILSSWNCLKIMDFPQKFIMHLLNQYLGYCYSVTVIITCHPSFQTYLLPQKTDSYGTVRINRWDLSLEFTKRKLHKGQIMAFQRDKGMAVRWKVRLYPFPIHLIEQHFITHIPPTPGKYESTRQCKVCCSKKDVNEKQHKASKTILVQRLRSWFVLKKVFLIISHKTQLLNY